MTTAHVTAAKCTTPVSSVLIMDQRLRSIDTDQHPSPTRTGRPIGHVEKYAMTLVQGLEAPGLLADCRVSVKALRAAAEADIERLTETVHRDNLLYDNFLNCITAIETDVPGRDLEMERATLLSQILKDLPQVSDAALPDSKEQIASRLRRELLVVSSRPDQVFARMADRQIVGRRRKLNDTGTVQCFTDYQLRVDDEVLSSETERETINTEVKERRYSTSTVKTDRVNSRHNIKTTETQITVVRVLAGVKELGIQAPVSQPARIAQFIAQCNSPLGEQFRLVTGGLCNYQESEQLLRQYEHHVQQEWTEQSKSREIHYHQMGRDVSAVAAGVASTIGALFTDKVARATKIVPHTDPTICFGQFVLTGFLPDGFDLSAFEEDRT